MSRGVKTFFVAALVAGCAEPLDTGVALSPASVWTTTPSARARLAACARDPRVVAGRLSGPACAAADLFWAHSSLFLVEQEPPR
ncbi:MAG TPA: hypothetical protein VNN80_14815 [Polyangiaceae bacterium]|nr:hypothetical protein [Polyangiaceae bacterium]